MKLKKKNIANFYATFCRKEVMDLEEKSISKNTNQPTVIYFTIYSKTFFFLNLNSLLKRKEDNISKINQLYNETLMKTPTGYNFLNK